ncbi:AI-2E family transporter [Roseomonas sp. E05]|uniref:AI-2E family transporter n=1 Tax=Roseomonas sp. E05 TaxID=3046310 RepID=UPI0024B8C466|nr:AI-2E family transporter [Roseomonas sp. E05]MDJ0391324.1 AI-2E family transporter [Roseomonas sp. E05]
MAMTHPEAVSDTPPNRRTGLLSAALIIAALYFGREVIVPLVLAVLLAFVLAPVVVLLRRAFVPHALAVVLAVLLSAAATLGLGLVMARQASSLLGNLSTYAENLRSKLQGLHLAELMREAQLAMQNLRGMIGGGGRYDAGLPAAPAAEAGTPPLEVIQSVAGSVLAPLATAGVVVLFAIFVLLYREDLRDRLIRLAGSRDLHRTTVALNDAARRLSRLFLAQVALNTGVGVMIGLALWVLGLPSPALWGILAGLMRFVPFLGTYIALAPMLLLAAAVEPGWGLALWVAGLFLAAELLMGQVVEPMVFGHSTGISPVAVVIAATFWTFIWGPIGLLLAVPLTVCLVVLGRHVPSLDFLDIMLGDRPSLRPEESFYQNLLQGNLPRLQEQAHLLLRAQPSLTAYHDTVALPGLVLADQDWAREVLEIEQLEEIRARLATLLEHLPGEVTEAPVDPSAGLCLCTPARGRLDDLSAVMAVQALRAEGLAAAVIAEGAESSPEMASAVRLCCIAVLEESSTAASLRYLARRWEKLLPEAQIAIGLWQAAPDSSVLAELRREAAGQTIVTSISELAALWRALVNQPTARTVPVPEA